ncbi:MAG: HyaD/HybD family hydrogenase maturation endopeptidase [Rhodospirillaceae bacterium]|nr:HyaD/HybD family hydrogenase maturation endopeptidase [Rhodospirillaceae bacterium]
MTAAATDGGAPDILVLGIGNVLLRDEGIGVHAVARLTERFDLPTTVAVVDGGTTGLDLLDLMAHRGHVIIVDAVAHDGAPGTVVRLTDGEIPAFLRMKLSPHQLGLADLLAVLRLTDEQPHGLTLLGLQPEDMELGLELSPRLASRIDTLVDAVAAELTALGVTVRTRDTAKAAPARADAVLP